MFGYVGTVTSSGKGGEVGAIGVRAVEHGIPYSRRLDGWSLPPDVMVNGVDL